MVIYVHTGKTQVNKQTLLFKGSGIKKIGLWAPKDHTWSRLLSLNKI